MESDQVHARAAIMRCAVDRGDAPGAEQGWLSWLAEQGIPAITDVDTRALVRHIRDQGAMRGGVFPGEVAESEARELIAAEPAMSGRDLAREVTPGEIAQLSGDGDGPRIAMIDTGVKRSIVPTSQPAAPSSSCIPARAGPVALTQNDPDAIFLANGPGDPAALDYVVSTVRELVGQASGLRDLPRPPAAVPGRRPRDLQAALRPPRGQPPGQGPDHRPGRDHEPEPRLRRARAGRLTHHRGR